MTALDLITRSLYLVNALAFDETLDIAQANDALADLNDMIDSWNAARLTIFTTRIDDFPFTLNKQTYTLGTGGDFDMPRPARIDAMSAILLTVPENPIEVPMAMYTVDEWQTQVPVKVVDSSFPQICYDGGEFPLRKLSFWPIPAFQQNSVRIYSWAALTQPATLQTTIAFPPGYNEAFRFNLAIRLAPNYGVPVPASVQQVAVESLGRIKTMNAPELDLRSDLVPDPAGWSYKADLFGIPF